MKFSSGWHNGSNFWCFLTQLPWTLEMNPMPLGTKTMCSQTQRWSASAVFSWTRRIGKRLTLSSHFFEGPCRRALYRSHRFPKMPQCHLLPSRTFFSEHLLMPLFAMQKQPFFVLLYLVCLNLLLSFELRGSIWQLLTCFVCSGRLHAMLLASQAAKFSLFLLWAGLETAALLWAQGVNSSDSNSLRYFWLSVRDWRGLRMSFKVGRLPRFGSHWCPFWVPCKHLEGCG